MLPPALTALCVGGLFLMTHLEGRADAARDRACALDRSSVHWSHGYDAWLPLTTVAAGIAAVVFAVAVLLVHREGDRSRFRALSVAAIPIVLIALFPAALAVEAYYSFPGPDVSTVGTHPCGSG
ncbi:hypothetical protein [Actinomadura sp. CNU-125]|uniref:hypothetical protein n=1 Tax=Actinomadura sp. CNU-125 TaxID=1904961 RepID=UPI00117876B0|nr:hypothetical protein [Actinomadura sp. CNU-125]